MQKNEEIMQKHKELYEAAQNPNGAVFAKLIQEMPLDILEPSLIQYAWKSKADGTGLSHYTHALCAALQHQSPSRISLLLNKISTSCLEKSISKSDYYYRYDYSNPLIVSARHSDPVAFKKVVEKFPIDAITKSEFSKLLHTAAYYQFDGGFEALFEKALRHIEASDLTAAVRNVDGITTSQSLLQLIATYQTASIFEKAITKAGSKVCNDVDKIQDTFWAAAKNPDPKIFSVFLNTSGIDIKTETLFSLLKVPQNKQTLDGLNKAINALPTDKITEENKTALLYKIQPLHLAYVAEQIKKAEDEMVARNKEDLSLVVSFASDKTKSSADFKVLLDKMYNPEGVSDLLKRIHEKSNHGDFYILVDGMKNAQKDHANAINKHFNPCFLLYYVLEIYKHITNKPVLAKLSLLGANASDITKNEQSAFETVLQAMSKVTDSKGYDTNAVCRNIMADKSLNEMFVALETTLTNSTANNIKSALEGFKTYLQTAMSSPQKTPYLIKLHSVINELIEPTKPAESAVNTASTTRLTYSSDENGGL